LFEGLKIAEYPEYMAYQGQYPVITLSLKGMKQPSYEYAFKMFRTFIIREFERHDSILKCDDVPPTLKLEFETIYRGTAEDSAYINAIRLLSDCLHIVHRKKVIILIDEYDVPLENAYFRGFYDEMVDLIRSAFESALKTNNSLEFGVLTGCLRISKESIFTGLNNLKVYSLSTPDFSEYFGFTRKEVEAFAAAYHLESRLDDIKDWYDGYLFGGTEIYNPWSIINFIADARGDRHALILDNLRVHHSKKVQAWLEKHKDEIEVFYLLPYAPEYNPDELVNSDLKRSVGSMASSQSKEELEHNVRSYLKSLQLCPSKISSFFNPPCTSYAA
ncbi:MAG: AAA family ATPase, partial [Oscillospiraceae bacterium]|nr:AAA family ATPase [Oscillospiraceae bacterium]